MRILNIYFSSIKEKRIKRSLPKQDKNKIKQRIRTLFLNILICFWTRVKSNTLKEREYNEFRLKQLKQTSSSNDVDMTRLKFLLN